MLKRFYTPILRQNLVTWHVNYDLSMSWAKKQWLTFAYDFCLSHGKFHTFPCWNAAKYFGNFCCVRHPSGIFGIINWLTSVLSMMVWFFVFLLGLMMRCPNMIYNTLNFKAHPPLNMPTLSYIVLIYLTIEKTSKAKSWGWKDQISLSIIKTFLAEGQADAQTSQWNSRNC